MNLSIYVENVDRLHAALDSRRDSLFDSLFDSIRFGSEFCEWKLPTLESLRQAFAATVERGKRFVYVTPRLSEAKLRQVESHLAQLDTWVTPPDEVRVVANDLGTVALLQSGDYANLRVQWGRQLTSVPARAHPPFDAMLSREGKLASTFGRKVFETTDLNYAPTMHLLRDSGVAGVDIDWVPKCFSASKVVARQGLELAVHSHLVLVTLTRKCHTARFLGEQTPDLCTRPCDRRVFRLEQASLGRLYLMGNAVVDKIEPSRRDFQALQKIGATEIVVSANPLLLSDGNDLGSLLDTFNEWIVPRGLSRLF